MRSKQAIILTLGLLTALAPFSIDTYLPAFSAIATDLHTDINTVAYSLSSFFFGISFGQLICGPLLDRYGRKKPLIIGLVLYVIAAIACMAAPSVEWLIALRVLLALGGSVGMVAGRAIVRDLFPSREMAGILSTLMLILGISPIIAPTVGGYISSVAGWRYIFGFLVFVSLVILALVIRILPESKPADASVSLRPKRILAEYASVATNPTFILYALVGGLASSALFSFIAGSPFVFMKLYHFTQTEYGWAFGVNASGMILGSQVNRLFLKWHTSEAILKKVSVAQSITASLLVAGTVFHQLDSIRLMSLTFLFLFFHGFINPNATATALFPFTRKAGSASALLGSIQMLLGAVASGLVSYFHTDTALPMIAGMAVSAWLGYLIQRAPVLTQQNFQTLGNS